MIRIHCPAEKHAVPEHRDYRIERVRHERILCIPVGYMQGLKEYFIKLVTRKLKYDDFWALTDVNFQIEKGERLGVLL